MEEQVFKKIMLPTVFLLFIICLLPDFFWKVPLCLCLLLTGATLSCILTWVESGEKREE
ncbi:hypothetical protein P7G51_06455 [Enterococcus asini]|uniref:hypothetical protein n=1 Tax=Enterococcus TaxID=1350 RepID=UPI00288CD298|nr:hypothetical protein [Enterococcus asini]MDT2757017.1 hypothetical protein [Enterococcus asini]